MCCRLWKSRIEEVRNTMEELAKANKDTSHARAASMIWDESRRRYQGQTMGPNWEQLPCPPIEGTYVDVEYPPSEKSEAEMRAEEKAEAGGKLRTERRNRLDSTPESEEEEKEYEEESRKQAERGRINKASRPPKEKRVDHAKKARGRATDTKQRRLGAKHQFQWPIFSGDRCPAPHPHGDVTSRLVSFTERVEDVIGEKGLRQQLKDPTMLRIFVKLIVACKRRIYMIQNGDEFLVSDDTLKTIGIDTDRLLEQVARLQVDNDGNELEEVGGDCVELRSAVRAASLKAALPVAKNEVEEALQGMIDSAVHNGFPMAHVKCLRDVLSKHNIWRLKLDGLDPPAKVKPVKVTPKDGCAPYRYKERKQNLLERGS
ncbi:hypothetical protein DYB30_010580 [Aphanomyces astaci]|uniref:Uncharacterized protein n=2 Tax=Aphanomyces astaci TaxID=112090 RepID=A0A397DTS4_APHAT|nr:hypothetical protein DYB36_006818 [Aphanomyces astaci]RHY47434.1 hypothetical protein DYB30_010580 [Aphanomyces astaci]RHY70944.1 hypothetical protein DYB38_008480 [Aphanomyces astaci]